MLKPDYGFHERKQSNVFVLGVAAAEGTLIGRDTTDVSVVGQGALDYGKVTTANVAVAGDRELGVLFWPETTNGPSFFERTAGVLDLSTAVGTPASIWHTSPGDILSTDQYLASGTGHLVVGQSSGNTAPDTMLGILNGQYVIASSFTATDPGSVVRAKLIGNTVIDGEQCIRVQVL